MKNVLVHSCCFSLRFVSKQFCMSACSLISFFGFLWAPRMLALIRYNTFIFIVTFTRSPIQMSVLWDFIFSRQPISRHQPFAKRELFLSKLHTNLTGQSIDGKAVPDCHKWAKTCLGCWTLETNSGLLFFSFLSSTPFKCPHWITSQSDAI